MLKFTLSIPRAVSQAILGAILMATLISRSAFAHDSSFPEGTLLALEGQDAATQKDCKLFVTNIGFSGAEKSQEQWYATVQTSYSHGSAKGLPITIKVHAPGTLAGAANQDQIAIVVDPQGTDLRNAKYFNLKWLHGDHFHTNRCLNLKVHND